MRPTHRDLVFAATDGHELKLDLYLPSNRNESSRPPLLVWIHGGGWRGGSKSNCPLRGFASEGWAVASISYRFSDVAIFPAQLHECKAAIRWLRAHADQYGYDPDHIVASGGSAGGTLALLLGVVQGDMELEGKLGDHLDRSSEVQAVINYFGPSDFVLRAKTQADIAYTEKVGSFAWLGGLKYGHVDRRLEKLASSTQHVSADSPPLLVFHGTDDRLVLMDQAERIVDVYREHGLDAKLIRVDGGAHGGAKFFTPENLQHALDFLTRTAPRKN
jgi:acetyl esterase/lipase